MDSFGKNILVPAAICGLTVLGYQVFRRIQDNNTEQLVTSNSNNVDQTAIHSTGGSDETSVLTNEKSKLVCDGTSKNQDHGLPTPESPLYTDGGGPSLEGNGNNNSSLNNSCSKQVAVQTEAQVPRLSPEAVKKIHDLESSFFKGLDQKANLSDDELGILGELLMKNSSSCSYKFSEILLAMREQGCFRTRCYKTTIMRILKSANIYPNDSVFEHLDMLEENIKITVSEDLQKNTRYKFEYDIVIVFTDDDHSKAVEFSQSVESKFESLDVRIASLSDIDGNTTELRGLENALRCAMYVFLLVSSNFKDDDFKRYVGETSLTECLQSQNAKWRVFPVWLERDIKRFKNCPYELVAMKGINFFHIIENQCEYSMNSVWKNLKTLIEKGRQQIQPVVENIA